MASSLIEQVKDVMAEPVVELLPFPAERRTHELLTLAEQIEIAGLRSLGETDRLSVPLALGYVSTQRYVAHKYQISPQAAAERTAVARLITRHDLTGKALGEGDIGLGHARLLAKAAAKFPAQYEAGETELLEVAAAQNLDDFVDTIARWMHDTDLEAAQEDTAHRYNGRGVWIQGRLDGSGTGRFDLAAVALATLIAGLDATAGKPDPKHALVQRTLAQRRADALEEMAMGYGPQEPDTGTGEPGTEETSSDESDCTQPHGQRRTGAVIEAAISVTLDGETPLAELLSDLWKTGPVPHTIIEQISCDATWLQVTKTKSQILNYSSPQADITPNQRRAIRHRDRHCQFHGCNRPWDWCDVHHIISRNDYGPTTLDNLTLMCRHHHSLLHQGGWQFTRNPITGETQTTSP